MIFSENRYPLFRIMLPQIGPAGSAGKSVILRWAQTSLVLAASLRYRPAQIRIPEQFETGAGAPKDQPLKAEITRIIIRLRSL